MNNIHQKGIEHVRSNPAALKHFIFFEAIHMEPIFSSYKKMCCTFGDDVMDYPDFEFWFMRFSNGEFDMDCDRSQDPKLRGLLDMPNEILDVIQKNLNSMERRVLRKVNKFFQWFVDCYNPEFEFISIVIEDNCTNIWFDNHRITYNQESFYHSNNQYFSGCNVVYRGRFKPVCDANHIDMALQDLILIVKNRKLNMKKMYVKFKTNNFNEDRLSEQFRNMNCKIRTPIVHIVTTTGRGEMAVLPYLESGTLGQILLEFNEPYSTFPKQTMDQHVNRLGTIGLLEQCQLAELVRLQLYQGEPGWFPLESFLGCSSVFVEFYQNNRIKIADVMRFRRTLLLPNVTMRVFHFRSKYDFTLTTLRRRLTVKSSIVIPNKPDVRRFKIRKSSQQLQVDFFGSDNISLDVLMTRKVFDFSISNVGSC